MWGMWFPVGVYIALIFGLSSIPNLAPPGNFEFSDKIAHFIEYGVLGVLLFRGLHSSGVKGPGRLILIILALGAGIAALDELYQGTVGRDASVWDWVADGSGLMVAGLGGALVLLRKGKGQP